MKRSSRTFLFFAFLLLFLVSVPVIIAYSQGYRVDWTNKALVQTGALSLEPRPAPVELLLDGVLVKRSNFVFQNIFAQDLLPRTYQVQIRKEGYHSWQKNLLVAPSLVTEAKNILLFPAAPLIQEIATDVESFFLSPTRSILAMIRESNNQQINIIPQDPGEISSILRISQDFASFKITKAQWNKDATRLLLLIESRAIKKWLLVDMRQSALRIFDLSSLSKGQILQPYWSPDNSSKIFFIARDITNSSLFSYNIEKEELSQSFANDVLFYTIRGNKALYISSQLFSLNSVDLANGNIQQVSHNPLFGIENDPSAMFIDLPEVVVHANNAVYLFNSDTNRLEVIADEVTEAIPSSDGKKLLLRSENTLRVYWLADIHIQPFRDKGAQEEIWRATSPIRGAAWVGEHNAHVIFGDDERIQVVELDGRDERNVHTLVEAPSSQIFYAEDSDTLYFLSGDILSSMSLK